MRRAPLRSCLYRGVVTHHRLMPVAHRFRYDTFSLWLDLDELGTIGRCLKLLSIERPNIMSFRARDHGRRDGSPLKPWVIETLAARGIRLDEPRIMLLCFPRLWGYVFNPLSVYFCYERGDRLAAILYEVKNTFGEQHCYALPVAAVHHPDALIRQGCDKAFYVSPFIPMEARYRFRLREPGERLTIGIREYTDEGCVLVATQTGSRLPLTDRSLATCLASNLLVTIKVIAAIHYEALRLWLKGVRLVPREGAGPRPAKPPVSDHA